jgi:hypothetical protein
MPKNQRDASWKENIRRNPPDIMSHDEAAAYVGISTSGLYALIKDPTSGFKPRKRGSRSLYLLEDIKTAVRLLPFADLSPA